MSIAAAAAAAPLGGAVEAAPRMKRAPSAKVTIKLSVWPDVQDMSVYQNIIKDFEATQSEIHVVPELFPSAYYAKVQTEMAAGTVPDIVYMQGWEWQVYGIAGALRPMDDFIKRDKGHLPNIWPAAYDPQTKWDGKTYMAPADTGPMVIFYNKAMFDKAHVPYPKEGWTLDDFVQTAKELTIKKGGKTIQYGYQANYPDYIRNIGWMRLGGHIEALPLVKSKKANFADPAITKYLQQQWGDMPLKMGISMPKGALLAGGGQGGNYLYGIQNGLVAMKYEGPWFMPQMVGISLPSRVVSPSTWSPCRGTRNGTRRAWSMATPSPLRARTPRRRGSSSSTSGVTRASAASPREGAPATALRRSRNSGFPLLARPTALRTPRPG